MANQYDPDFIGSGINVPMPTFGPQLDPVILRKNNLRSDIYSDHTHYSLVMNEATRQVAYAASNIDRAKMLTARGSTSWRLDREIGRENQLNNDYYKFNPWDKGHIVMRMNNSWGDDQTAVDTASEDTYFYANASMQHEYFNKDEWVELEKYFGGWGGSTNGKLYVFTGPVHLPTDRNYALDWRESARIPSGFFKVLCYQDLTTELLSVKSFIMYQDATMIADRDGGDLARTLDFLPYQVTITEIQHLTGLVFDPSLYAANPLFATGEDVAPERFDTDGIYTTRNIDTVPERIVITDPVDIVETETVRTREIPESEKKVVITAAMVNPSGYEANSEWVTIQNISGEPQTIDGWELQDQRKRTIPLSGTLEAGQTQQIYMREHRTISLLNSGGTLILWNGSDTIFDIQKYFAEQLEVEDQAIRFS